MRATVAKRTRSIVPQQYLFLLNSEFMVDRARALSKKLKQHSADSKSQIEFAYQLLFGRKPTAGEFDLGMQFIAREKTGSVENLEKYCHVLLSSNEFFFIQ